MSPGNRSNVSSSPSRRNGEERLNGFGPRTDSSTCSNCDEDVQQGQDAAADLRGGRPGTGLRTLQCVCVVKRCERAMNQPGIPAGRVLCGSNFIRISRWPDFGAAGSSFHWSFSIRSRVQRQPFDDKAAVLPGRQGFRMTQSKCSISRSRSSLQMSFQIRPSTSAYETRV